MKKLKILVLMGVLMAMCFGLVSCILPEVVPNDPDQRDAAPTASFSYYPPEYPVQTGSRVLFDGRNSHDSDGVIVWGEWDFGDGTVVDGVWTKVVQRFENGVEVFETVSVMREEHHTYTETPQEMADRLCIENENCTPPAANVGSYYTVTLTVWDDDDNEVATSRQIKIAE